MNDDDQPPSVVPIEQDACPLPGARLLLILGGARSGKSTFAEKLALQSGQTVALIATATAGDEEMRARIARHQAARPTSWQTIEEPLDLPGAVRRASELADVLLLDCMTLWTSNWLLRPGESVNSDSAHTHQLFDAAALQEIEKLLETLRALPASKALLAISNEVGSGIVPAYALGRVYRDTLGYINQRLASVAERVYLLVAGLAIDIKRLHEEASLF